MLQYLPVIHVRTKMTNMLPMIPIDPIAGRRTPSTIHLLSNHIILCHIMPYHIILYHIISYYIISYHTANPTTMPKRNLKSIHFLILRISNDFYQSNFCDIGVGQDPSYLRSFWRDQLKTRPCIISDHNQIHLI